MFVRFAVVATLVTGSLVVLGGGARAAKRDWTGSAACGSCHAPEYEAWKATPHATTASRFGNQPAPTKCLACHATGEAPAGPAIAVEVGCESCHGAGAAYAEDDVMRDPPVSRALGLVDVSTPKARTAVCLTCHARGTTTKPFDPMSPVHPVKKQTAP